MLRGGMSLTADAVERKRTVVAGADVLAEFRLEVHRAAQMGAAGIEAPDGAVLRLPQVDRADLGVGELVPGILQVGDDGKHPRRAVGRKVLDAA